ncbi:uncharacterized protein Z520_03660 [Fonsecaea multimorphosa CBS 102226]|uniref:Uncharacterized protein n=1 Tax=Fonsecaea multimorphosa CBS 102226 TaxID=1442371 RepID=A0A0D2KW65_9EURO|nr:uncharacterized protein Z520_03660 [Fonsecaea multimorphosa CBS 102226]KIY00994.1 hypothetical protein Z520_03660 [Fonsecaea multimorphosa CBS 102226]
MPLFYGTTLFTGLCYPRDQQRVFLPRAAVLGPVADWSTYTNCYGRRLAKYDGQAGTALIVLDPASHKGNGLNETAFMARLLSELRAKGVSKYAVPRLVMVQEDLVDAGVTFKQAKNVVKNID